MNELQREVRAYQRRLARKATEVSALVGHLLRLHIDGKISDEELRAAVVSIDRVGWRAASVMAAEFIERARAISDPGGKHAPPVVPRFDPVTALEIVTGFLLSLELLRGREDVSGDEYARLVARIMREMQTGVLDVARVATELSAAANGKYWMRVTDGDPCAFCAMIAGRAIYTSELSALRVVGSSRSFHGTREYSGRLRSPHPRKGDTGEGGRKRPRKRTPRQLGELYHNDCGCTAVEVSSPMTERQLENYNRLDEFKQAYYDAQAECRKDGVKVSDANILQRMRRRPGFRDSHKRK